MQAGDEDDDFMPLSKKRNFDDSPPKVLKKIVGTCSQSQEGQQG
jgi:hypothetical protein